MKKILLILSLNLIVLNIFFGQTCKYSLDEEKPPDDIPVIFGKGILSKDSLSILGLSFSPDGDELVFSIRTEGVYYMKKESGIWSKPELMDFSKKTLTHIMYPKFSPYGTFISFVDGNAPKFGSGDIFKINRLTDNTWSDSIIKLLQPVNSDKRDAGHCFTRNGTLYFTSGRTDNTWSNNILKATPKAENDYEIEVLSNLSIFCIETDEECLYVSPYEEYLITDSWRKKSKHKHDLFISFKTDYNGWSELKPLNHKINTDKFENIPFVSSDNKYLFFCRSLNNISNFYWVSTKEVFTPYLNLQIPDFFERVENEILLTFPGNVFKDFNGKIIEYELQVEGYNEFPKFLNFDKTNMTIKGKPLKPEILNCFLTAKDNDGNISKADFKIIIEE